MRPLATSPLKTTATEATTTAKATFSPPIAVVQRSPWHSPVPYLFGGLAAMLGLIAFALLILACSYWKLSGSGDSDVEGGSSSSEKGRNGSDEKVPTVFEEKFLVIMAGDAKPTFLATPAPSTSASTKIFRCGNDIEGNVNDDGNDQKIMLQVKIKDCEEPASANGDGGEHSQAVQERTSLQ